MWHNDVKLCFDDILLLPGYSSLMSRKEPDISSTIGNVNLEIPIISSPMDSITGEKMLTTLGKNGALGILSRFIQNGNDNVQEEIDRQCKIVSKAKEENVKYVGCAIGIKSGCQYHAKQLLDHGCDVICIDIAHGDHHVMYDAISEVNNLKNHYSFTLMAGNVCTESATKAFMEHGVDAIKIGIGPGAACTTRNVTGFGIPQLSAILECSKVIKEQNSTSKPVIIADGGIRTTGDMVKALWAGASAIMGGYIFAGTSDTPDINGRKLYRGMSSRSASGRSDIAPEGVEFNVTYKGDTLEKLVEYAQGIKSGLAMGGARNLEELRHCQHVRVSPLSMKETMPVSCL